jgi:ubiquitin related modifier 1
LCSGGLELLFDNEKELALDVPAASGKLSLDELILFVRDNCLKERPELFVADDSV